MRSFLSPPAPNGIPSLGRDFGRKDSPAELHGLIDILGKVRQRILTNTFLRGLTKWWTWVLIGLIAVATISVRLAGVMTLAAVLVIAGTAFILSWIWRTRISIYDTACRLDSAAGLQDRISTAIYLGDTKDPDEMMQLQREDALVRLEKISARGLFPIRMPAIAKRAVVVVFIAAGLLAYRIHHKPPLVSLLQTTERSQLVQSFLSPLVQAMERDVQKTVALVTKPDSDADEVRSGDTKPPPDDLWQNGNDQQDSTQQGNQGVPNGDSDEQTQQLSGNQNGQNSADSQQEQQQQQSSSGGQMQQNQNPNNQSTNKSGQQQDSQQATGQSQSLGQSLMQALKNMMSNSQSQQSNNRGNQDTNQSSSQGMPQSGSADPSNSNQNGQKGDSRASSNGQQKPSQSASNGAGTQEGLKQKRTDFDSHQVTAVPDRVALETNTYKEEMRMRTETEAGTSQMATHDVSSQTTAVVNGAEQENIPARYRMFVQHYFEHAANEPQDNTQPVNAQPDNGQQGTALQKNSQQGTTPQENRQPPQVEQRPADGLGIN